MTDEARKIRQEARARILSAANVGIEAHRRFRMRHIQMAVHRVRWLRLVDSKTLDLAGYNPENKR